MIISMVKKVKKSGLSTISQSAKKKVPRSLFAGICTDGCHASIALAEKGGLVDIGSVNALSKSEMRGWIYRYIAQDGIQKHGIIELGYFSGERHIYEKIATRLWVIEDVVFVRVAQAPPTSLARKAEEYFVRNHGLFPCIGANRKLHPWFLTNLDYVRAHSRPRTFARMLKFSRAFSETKKKVVFISSTSRGGGVSLMRHALIRLFDLLGISASWCVMTPDNEVFHVTKKKFHNVLQGVSVSGVQLNEEDKIRYRAWIEKNYRRFKPTIAASDIVIIDDPQPSGLISLIKAEYPAMKIVYRSHIQVDKNAVKKKGSPQKITWDFLWNEIRAADLFISHPVKNFVPGCVERGKLIYMPACTDPFDGLNKELNALQEERYIARFNRILGRHDQAPLDRCRPVIAQIARFDPSKGIPDVLDAYRDLRNALANKKTLPANVPQLVITGHMAIDDPEGNAIFGEIMTMLAMDRYALFSKDIKVVPLPPSDQLLNAILRRADVILQLSHREGFEVKVTEALMKGKPVIAYKIGGLPLQIKHGKSGYLVRAGNTKRVAKYLYKLFTDKKLYRKMTNSALELADTRYFTVNNASRWLKLFVELADGKSPHLHSADTVKPI